MSDSSALLRRRNAGAFKQLAARYLRLRERKKVGIDLVLLRRAHTVWRALVDLQLRVLDQLDGQQGGVTDRHDLVVVAVQDERRHVHLLEVLGEIRLGERLDAVKDAFESALHSLEPKRVSQALGDLRTWPVGAVERHAEILEELRAVGKDTGADTVECLDRQASGIRVRLEHQRWNRANQHSLGYAFRAVTADIAGDFASACRVPDMDRVLQLERFDECREIVGVGVHVVANPRLARSAVRAPVMSNAAISMGCEKGHLVLPRVRG